MHQLCMCYCCCLCFCSHFGSMHETRASQKMSGVMLSSSSAMLRKTFHRPSTTICLACGSSASQKHQQRPSTVAGMHAASSQHMNTFNNVVSHSRKIFEPISFVLGRSAKGPCALRCFSAYEQRNAGRRFEAGSDFPRPPVIPFQKDLANCIHLIGHVGKEPDIKYFDSGKVCARSSMAVRKTARLEDAPSWFALEFWDELAEIAAHHLKKGDKIHVAGVVVVDKFEKDQDTVTIVKVVVQDVNYIALQTESYSDKGMSLQDKKLEKEKLWHEFFENPSEWWDNRGKKMNLKSPDFKHKTSGAALWVDSAPQWVKPLIQNLDLKRDLGSRSSAAVSAGPY